MCYNLSQLKHQHIFILVESITEEVTRILIEHDIRFDLLENGILVDEVALSAEHTIPILLE